MPKNDKNDSRKSKIFASAVGVGVLGTLVYFPNRLKLVNSISVATQIQILYQPLASVPFGDEFFLWNGWPMKGVKPYFQPGQLSEMPYTEFEP